MSWQTDLAARARSAMPAPMWAYTQAGSGEGTTASESERAWHDVRFAPRVLRDVTVADTATRLLAAELTTPIGVAPTALQRAAHPQGEIAMARGAAAAGALHVVSSNAGHRFSEIDAGSPWWVQAYVPPTRDDALPMLTAAAEAGAQAVVLTVDTPFQAPKELPPDVHWADVDLSWFRCNCAVPGHVRWAADLVPDDIGWLRRALGLPVVVKGAAAGRRPGVRRRRRRCRLGVQPRGTPARPGGLHPPGVAARGRGGRR